MPLLVSSLKQKVAYRLHFCYHRVHSQIRERSSVVERCPDKTEVEGPIPSGPTKKTAKGGFLLLVFGEVV